MSRILSLFIAASLAVSAVFAQSTPDGSLAVRLGFGGALAMQDGKLYVGSAPIGWPTGSDPAGKVHEYSRDEDGAWVETAVISAADGAHGDEFGRAILAADGMLLIAATGRDAVYVFEPGDNGWKQTGKIEPGSALPANHEFGGAYARGGFRTQTMANVGGTWLVASHHEIENEGAIHIVHHMGSMWHTMGAVSDAPAWSLASLDNSLIAGIPSANEGAGAIHLYSLTESGSWTDPIELTAEGLGANAALGQTLAATGNRLFVGAPNHERFGAVLVFERNAAGDWAHTGTLQQSAPEADGPQPNNGFGRGLAVSGNSLVVGANRAAFVYNIHHLDVAPFRIEAPEQQAGNGFGVGVAIEGDVLAVGAPDADYGSGLTHIYERTEDGAWQLAGSAGAEVVRMTSIMTGEKVECEDGLVNGLFPCEGIDLLSMVSTDDLVHDRGANLNDIWGWTDPETGKEYVLAGRTDGSSFIDISDPYHPVTVGQIMRTEGSPGAWWRDIKTYKNYAYIVADGSGDHGMQVFDLTRLRNVDPADMPVTFEPDMTYRGVASSHNVIINEESGFGYAVGSSSGANGCGGGLHMLDLHDPGNPQFVGCYIHPDFRGVHDAQCVNYRGSDADYVGHEVCLSSNGRALVLADMTDKDNPNTIAVAEYPNTAYTHQGWLSEDHNWFYMNDELDEMNGIVEQTRTLVWDMSDLDEPVLVNEFYHSNGASDHNLYVRDNLIYESNYQSGLRILDITDPANPVEVASFDTAPYADNVKGFAGSWSNYPYFKSGVIVVSSQAEGVFILKKQEQDL